MHLCMDEVVAALAVVPFLGYAVMRGRHLWHRVWHRGLPRDDGCCPPGHDHP